MCLRRVLCMTAATHMSEGLAVRRPQLSPSNLSSFKQRANALSDSHVQFIARLKSPSRQTQNPYSCIQPQSSSMANSSAGRTAVSMGYLMSFAKRVPEVYSTVDVVMKIVGAW
jgi:hypothetical protein